MIVGRQEANKWKRRLEDGGFLELEGDQQGELVISRLL
jgi:hypothetical protein